MFDSNVSVDAGEYQLHADRVFAFLDGTNDLKRIVAVGGVSITNDLRVGTCEKATYSKASQKIVMYGDGDEVKAKLESLDPKQKGSVEGRRITFWIGSEQVEVEGSTVKFDGSRLEKRGGAGKFFGK